MSTFPVTKKLLIDSQSNNGKCYLRLLTMTPNFAKSSGASVEAAIIYMSQKLGSNPIGTDVLTELFICNEVLGGNHNFPEEANYDSLNAINSIQFMTGMFNSKFRYAWEEIGGVQHIGSYTETQTSSREVWTIDGYSSRFILCTIISPTCRIGSEANFEGLFERLMAEAEDEQLEVIDEENVGEDSFSDSGLAVENEELKSKLNDRLSEIEKLNSKMRRLQREMSMTSKHQANDELDDLTVNNFDKIMKTQIQKNKIRSELRPEDSSSVIDRYNRKFMDEGTILTVMSPGKTKICKQVQTTQLRPEKKVVVGFQKTPEILRQENAKWKNIKPINGLANPFQSHRLNLLCHFDTAVRSIQTSKEGWTHYDTLVWINEHKSRTPSQELLYQIVSNTFDFEQSRVVANPFKLPFLEVNMILSDDALAKCFDMLRLEFKMLWFDNLKSIIVPDFHNEYVKTKEDRLTSQKDKAKVIRKLEVEQPKPMRNRQIDRRKPQSFFSLTS